ncbi:hypothetical protein HanRHA438_Chr06g0283911 [Helianthus annuus]|nr:hypothetical protein HanRHA438_Chr06g0283911 [Helianthus annuus]
MIRLRTTLDINTCYSRMLTCQVTRIAQKCKVIHCKNLSPTGRKSGRFVGSNWSMAYIEAKLGHFRCRLSCNTIGPVYRVQLLRSTPRFFEINPT